MKEKNTITDQEKDKIKAILKNREAMEARNPKDHYYYSVSSWELQQRLKENELNIKLNLLEKILFWIIKPRKTNKKT